MALRAGLVLGFHTLMTLLSPQEAGATKADHMGSYGPPSTSLTAPRASSPMNLMRNSCSLWT
nr:truncated MHC class II antigen [Homo sapiens]